MFFIRWLRLCIKNIEIAIDILNNSDVSINILMHQITSLTNNSYYIVRALRALHYDIGSGILKSLTTLRASALCCCRGINGERRMVNVAGVINRISGTKHPWPVASRRRARSIVKRIAISCSAFVNQSKQARILKRVLWRHQ